MCQGHSKGFLKHVSPQQWQCHQAALSSHPCRLFPIVRVGFSGRNTQFILAFGFQNQCLQP